MLTVSSMHVWQSFYDKDSGASMTDCGGGIIYHSSEARWRHKMHAILLSSVGCNDATCSTKIHLLMLFEHAVWCGIGPGT